MDYANNVLNAKGLKINDNDISEQFNDKVPKGQIISQTPKKDTEITENDKVIVVISKGPEVKYATVPNLVTLDAEVAKARLSDVNLKAAISYKETQNENDNNKVLSQSNEGAKLPQGTTINVEVGKYVAKQVTPPTNGPGSTTPGTGTPQGPGATSGTGTPQGAGTTSGTTQGKTTTPNTTNKNTTTNPLDSTKTN